MAARAKVAAVDQKAKMDDVDDARSNYQVGEMV